MLLRNIFKRIGTLSDKSVVPTELGFMLESRQPTPDEILVLDDNLLMTQLGRWAKSKDSILSDLCHRILDRRLLKGIEIPWDKLAYMYEDGRKELERAATKAGYDPEYFCALDNPVDTPYRPYRPSPPDGKNNVITQIFVLDRDGQPQEVSHESAVVGALSNTQYSLRLYFPKEIRASVRDIFK